MSDGAQHHDGDLQRATERLQTIQQNAASITELAADSNPGSETWGMIGRIGFEQMVASHLEDMYDHLRQMSECLLDHVGAMDQNRTFYQVQEQELSDAVDELDEAINAIDSSEDS